MNRTYTALTYAAALGSATAGGTLFAFSTFVMKGLARLPHPQGLAAMQSINVTATSPGVFAVLLGTAAASVPLAIHAFREPGETARPLLLAGSALFLVGTFAVTGAYHVPRNEALAKVDPASAQAPALWQTYVADWTRMNHVRTAAGLAAAAFFIAALAADAKPGSAATSFSRSAGRAIPAATG